MAFSPFDVPAIATTAGETLVPFEARNPDDFEQEALKPRGLVCPTGFDRGRWREGDLAAREPLEPEVDDVLRGLWRLLAGANWIEYALAGKWHKTDTGREWGNLRYETEARKGWRRLLNDAANLRADSKTDNQPKKSMPVPGNPDVAKLATRINRDRQKTGMSKTDIARDFCENNERKAQTLLRELRRFPHLLDR
jgi:hypothetical protein